MIETEDYTPDTLEIVPVVCHDVVDLSSEQKTVLVFIPVETEEN